MAGGIESQLVELLTRLDRTRFDPHVLCLYGKRAGRAPHFAAALRAAEIPVEQLDLGWSVRDKLRAAARIVATVRTTRPALVQLEGYHANLLARAVRPALPTTRLIGTIRGRETRKQLLYQRLGQWACTCLVASGPHLRRMLVESAGVPATKVVVIPNAVDVLRFAAAPPGAAALRRRLAPNGERVLLSVGRISSQKRMHLIPEALTLLRQQGRLPAEVRVCLLGQVEDDAMQVRLEAAIAAGDLADVVIQLPPTTTPEEYYHACDATLLYTVLEGISIAMLESLAAGRPVIVSDEANAAGVIEDQRTGWVVPTHELPRFAETLAQVLALPAETLRRMGEACRARAENYSIDQLVRRYSDLYASLARAATR